MAGLFFEVVARIPLSGDAITDAVAISTFAPALDEFRATAATIGGTVTTRTTKTMGKRAPADAG